MALARIRKIWPDVADGEFDVNHYAALIHHLGKASELVSGPTAPFATRSLDDTLDLIAHMRAAANTPATLANMPRETLVEQVKRNLPGNPDDESVLNAVCLGLSLWLTMNIVPSNRPQVGLRDTAQSEWSNGSTLSEVIASTVPRKPSTRIGLISGRMTAEYLEAYHGFMVVFTDILSEHLDIRYGNGTSRKHAIMVYQHKVFLWNELSLSRVSPLPRKYVEEVLDTLNILLPHGHTHTERFLERRRMKYFSALGNCGRPQRPELSHYAYFGDRLDLLSGIADSPPTGINQILPGRGLVNFKESATFWVTAIVITILTVASIVLAALSYDVSKRSLDLTDRQYRLSLAQACATMNSTQLPDWCP